MVRIGHGPLTPVSSARLLLPMTRFNLRFSGTEGEPGEMPLSIHDAAPGTISPHNVRQR